MLKKKIQNKIKFVINVFYVMIINNVNILCPV
jgi:hypothetical protein